MHEADADNPVVTLSDDVVTLRPWSREDAGFIADASAAGRVVSVLEGGYDLEGLANSAAAHVAALMQG